MDNVSIAFNSITILAIVAGPILALQVQRWLDAGREAKTRKLWIFRTLMSYRATRIAPAFVQALNLIGLDFDGSNKKEKQVLTAWRVLLDHLSDAASIKDDDKTATLTTDLLIAMGKCVGYEFNPVEIKKGAYHPVGLVNIEEESHAVRRQVLEVLSGNRRVPVAVFEDKFPPITMPTTEIPGGGVSPADGSSR
jgi:hypothetical protein